MSVGKKLKIHGKKNKFESGEGEVGYGQILI